MRLPWLKIKSIYQKVVVALVLLSAVTAANAQVTVNSVTIPQNIGTDMIAGVSIAWTRTGASDSEVITVPIIDRFTFEASAECSVDGSNIVCPVPAGGNGTVFFDIRGAEVGGFNLTATATGGSTASQSSNIRRSGDLTIANVASPNPASPADPVWVAGQTVTFTLNPEILAGDDVPNDGSIVVTNTLPATVTDFELDGIRFSARSLQCVTLLPMLN